MIIQHVLPINDIRPHSEELDMYLDVFPVPKCKCLPKPMLDPETGGWIIVHSAFDGREALEEVNETLETDRKIAAAKSVVSNSVLHGDTIEAKIKYISRLLPGHYVVKESKQAGAVHCTSNKGINDDEQWVYVLNAIKQRFNDFQELFHNVCYHHVDFTIYFKK